MSDENQKLDGQSSSLDSAVAVSAGRSIGAPWGAKVSVPLVVFSCLLLFQVGVLCGFWWVLPGGQPEVPIQGGASSETLPDRKDQAKTPAIPDRDILNALDNAEYQQVLDALANTPSDLTEEQTYWKALAAEGRGNEEGLGNTAQEALNSAQTLYQQLNAQAAEPGSENLFARISGAVGWGRIRVKQLVQGEVLDSEDDKSLDKQLCDIVLRSGDPSLVRRPSTADAFSLLAARLMRPDLNAAGTGQPFRFEMPPMVKHETVVRYVSKRVPAVLLSETLFSPPFRKSFSLPFTIPSQDTISVAGSFKSVAEMIDRWEAASNDRETVRWEPSAQARAQLPLRLDLNVNKMPRDDFLNAVMHRCGFQWKPREPSGIIVELMSTTPAADSPTQRVILPSGFSMWFGMPFDRPLRVSEETGRISAAMSFASVGDVIDRWKVASGEPVEWADQDLEIQAHLVDSVKLNLDQMPREAFLTCVLRRVGLRWTPLEEKGIRIQAVGNNQADNSGVGLPSSRSIKQLLDFTAQLRLPATPLGDFLRLWIAKQCCQARQFDMASHVLLELCQSCDSRISSYAAFAHHNLGLVNEATAYQLGYSQTGDLSPSSAKAEEFNQLQERALTRYRNALENWPSRELQLKIQFAQGRLRLHSSADQERARGIAGLTRLASDIARFRRLGLLPGTDADEFELIEGRAAVLLAMGLLNAQRSSPEAESQLKQFRDVIAPRDLNSAGRNRRLLQAAGALVSALAVFPQTPEPVAEERLRKQIGRALEMVASPPEPVAKERPRKQIGRELGMVATPPEWSWLGQCGRYWIAEGYWKLGIPRAALASYQESLRRSPYGHWSQQMRRRMLDYYRTTKDASEIQRQYEALISTASDAQRRKYQQERVEFWLDSGEKMADAAPAWDKCLEWSKELYNSADPPEKKRLMLELMGRVYEKMGNDANALKCFNGTWEEDPQRST